MTATMMSLTPKLFTRNVCGERIRLRGWDCMHVASFPFHGRTLMCPEWDFCGLLEFGEDPGLPRVHFAG